MKRILIAIAGAVALALGVVTSGGAALAATPSGAASTAWQLAWSSNFAGAAGTAPSGWNFEQCLDGTVADGCGNEEQEYYVSAAQNATTQNAVLDGNGDLAITVRQNTDSSLQCEYNAAGSTTGGPFPCAYTSARLDSSSLITAQYGRIEARIELPMTASNSVGIWPAFWAVGTDIGSVGWPTSGEIDMAEAWGDDPGRVAGHLHGPIAGTSNPVQSYGPGGGYVLPGGQVLGAGFHTFAADWYPGHVSFSVDGHIYETIYKSQMPSGDTWVFDQPFYLILNVAVGSAGSGGGAPNSSTTFPQTMLVNYVNVYTYTPPTAAATGTVTGDAGMCLDDYHSGTTSGNPIDVWTCNQTDAQNWTFGTDGTIQDFGMCLEPSGGATTSGTDVVLATCNGSTAQQWQIETDGSIANDAAPTLCLDDYGQATTDGSLVDIWTCTPSAAEIWAYPEGTAELLNSGTQSTCLDANSNDYPADGDAVQLWSCSTDSEQEWNLNAAGELENTASGMCLDANSNDYPDEGDAIQLWSCDGNPEQVWETTSSGQLENTSSGLCLDANSKDYASDGDNMQLWDCNTNPEQLWQFGLS